MIALLAGHTGATDSDFTVHEIVTGFSRGTEILYAGYPVGMIEGIEPVDGRRRFRVELSVNRGWKPVAGPDPLARS